MKYMLYGLLIFLLLFIILDTFSDYLKNTPLEILLYQQHWVARLLIGTAPIIGIFILYQITGVFDRKKKLYQELFNHMRKGIIVYEAVDDGYDFVFIDFNTRVEKKEGFKKETTIGKKITEVAPNIKNTTLFEKFQKVYKSGKEEYYVDLQSNDDVKKWHENYIYKLPTNEIIAISTDITHIKQSEQEFKKNEEKLKITFESIADGVITTDKDLKIKMINKAAEDILNINKFDIIDKKLEEIFNSDKIAFDNLTVKEIAHKVLDSGTGITLPQVKYFDLKENTKILEDRMSPIKGTDGMEGLILVFRDITNKIEIEEKAKKLEDQLFHTQKMETIGQFSGGIAHDFNNILTIISGNVDVILMKESTNYNKELLQIKDAIDRAANLTKKLLAFSKKQFISPHVVDINEVINSMSDMIARIIGENIYLDNSLLCSTKNIKADVGQLEQIMFNLTANSRDALNESQSIEKKISIKTFDFNSNEENIDLPPGEYVVLEVKDNGCGIDEGIKEKIFEPFFTTKKHGMGTGLGLSTVYGIVKQNFGSITVNSKKDKGSTFRIYWPVCNEERRPPIIKEYKEKNTKGTETILFVEDDKNIREVASSYLHQLGYKIVEASNGKEALNNDLTTIDVLVTDLVMPEMNGDELARKITNIAPKIKILYTSGYSNIQLEILQKQNLNLNFLSKPYSLAELARSIRKIIV